MAITHEYPGPVIEDHWSDLGQYLELPNIDFDRLRRYRLNRLKAEMRNRDVAVCVLLSPISLRYAVNYRNYALFQSHIPTTYLFVPQDGPLVIHGANDPAQVVDDTRPARALAFFDGGPNLKESAAALASDIRDYLNEIGSQNRRVAIEYVNPSVTQALEAYGLEVVDGVSVSESARVIKSEDEIACIRWAIAVAEFGIDHPRTF